MVREGTGTLCELYVLFLVGSICSSLKSFQERFLLSSLSRNGAKPYAQERPSLRNVCLGNMMKSLHTAAGSSFGFGAEQSESHAVYLAAFTANASCSQSSVTVLPGYYFKKSLKILLTAISSELMMPSVVGAFC